MMITLKTISLCTNLYSFPKRGVKGTVVVQLGAYIQKNAGEIVVRASQALYLGNSYTEENIPSLVFDKMPEDVASKMLNREQFFHQSDGSLLNVLNQSFTDKAFLKLRYLSYNSYLKFYLPKYTLYRGELGYGDYYSEPAQFARDITLKGFRKHSEYEDLKDRKIQLWVANPSPEFEEVYDVALIRNIRENHIFTTKSINKNAVRYPISEVDVKNIISKFNLEEKFSLFSESEHEISSYKLSSYDNIDAIYMAAMESLNNKAKSGDIGARIMLDDLLKEPKGSHLSIIEKDSDKWERLLANSLVNIEYSVQQSKGLGFEDQFIIYDTNFDTI